VVLSKKNEVSHLKTDKQSHHDPLADQNRVFSMKRCVESFSSPKKDSCHIE